CAVRHRLDFPPLASARHLSCVRLRGSPTDTPAHSPAVRPDLRNTVPRDCSVRARDPAPRLSHTTGGLAHNPEARLVLWHVVLRDCFAPLHSLGRQAIETRSTQPRDHRVYLQQEYLREDLPIPCQWSAAAQCL